MTFREEQIGPCRLILGDCLPTLGQLDEMSIDSVITDPPYCAGAISESQRIRASGQGLRSENIRRFGWFVGDNMGTAGLAMLLRSVAFECCRICKPSASLLVFCDWRMVANLEPSIESAGVRFQNLVVWDKGSMGLGSGFRAQHELVLHFTFGSPEYCDLGTGNVIRCARVGSDDRQHQTEKPVDLLKQLIEVVSPIGGRILDPFMGSGSTAEACIAVDREFVGMERDTANFDIACRRIERAWQNKCSELPFDPPPVETQPELFGETA
jgi:DNA modification methylase